MEGRVIFGGMIKSFSCGEAFQESVEADLLDLFGQFPERQRLGIVSSDGAGVFVAEDLFQGGIPHARFPGHLGKRVPERMEHLLPGAIGVCHS